MPAQAQRQLIGHRGGRDLSVLSRLAGPAAFSRLHIPSNWLGSMQLYSHTRRSTDTATSSTEFTLQHSHRYKHRPQSHSYKRRISGYCIHTLIIRLQRTVRNEFPILRPNLSAFVAHSTLLSTMYEICSPAWGRGLLVYSRTSETHLTR